MVPRDTVLIPSIFQCTVFCLCLILPFLKSQINNDLSQIYSPPALNNLNTKIFIQHMYYGEQLVNISSAMPLHDVKFGLHAD